MTVPEYVTEEVTRQGHDILTLDGIERVGWMLDAWSDALRWSNGLRLPEIADAIALGIKVERVTNREGMRKCGVMVGSRVCPRPEKVMNLLEELWHERGLLTPMAFYRRFEEIHPFEDGNGRTGKILLNWMNGSLLRPIFPPPDLWGRVIRNP